MSNSLLNSKLQYTPVEAIPQIHARLLAGHAAGKLKSIAYRKEQLLQLAYLLRENTDQFIDAFQKDLGRPPQDTIVLELNGTIGECVEAYNHVDSWARPAKPPFSLQFSAMKPVIYKQPKGVSLIIGPFNYPLWCSLSILAGAIAAGCPSAIKMSEMTPTISSLVAELWPKYMDTDLFAIVNGGIPETSTLLDLKWAHIVFTGSGTVGKIVATAAAKHLTPVTLELGGQSPTIIDPKSDLKMAARRILWGKTINDGQTCTAPNHIFVPEEGVAAFTDALREAYASFYPKGAAKSDAVARIVSDAAFSRLKGLLDGTKGDIILGGEHDASTKFMAPTIVNNVALDDVLMKGEIFGPILAIVPVKDFDHAIRLINERDHPLAVYLFSQDAALKKKVIENTTSGAIGINETVMHGGVPGLPFGGVGTSGYGSHTGVYGFNTFTHDRASIDSPSWIDYVLSWRFPPYSDAKFKQASKMSPKIPAPRPGSASASGWGIWGYGVAGVGLVAALFTATKV